MHITPLRVSRLATNAMRFMLVSRSSRLKPNPLLKCVRTISPSSTSTLSPCSLKRHSMISERVLFPEPERPVNQMVKPVFVMYALFLCIPFATSNIGYICFIQPLLGLEVFRAGFLDAGHGAGASLVAGAPGATAAAAGRSLAFMLALAWCC